MNLLRGEKDFEQIFTPDPVLTSTNDSSTPEPSETLDSDAAIDAYRNTNDAFTEIFAKFELDTEIAKDHDLALTPDISPIVRSDSPETSITPELDALLKVKKLTIYFFQKLLTSYSQIATTVAKKGHNFL